MAMEGAPAACPQEHKELPPILAVEKALLAFVAATESSAEGSTTSKDALVAYIKAFSQGHEEAAAKAASLAVYAKDLLARTSDKVVLDTSSPVESTRSTVEEALLALMLAAEGSATNRDALVAYIKAFSQGHGEAVAKAASLAVCAKDLLARTTKKVEAETSSPVESIQAGGAAAEGVVDPSCASVSEAASAKDSIAEKDTAAAGAASGAGAQSTPEAKEDAACGLDAKSRLELAKAKMFHWNAFNDIDAVHGKTKPFDQTTWHLVVHDYCGKGDMDALRTLLAPPAQIDQDQPLKPVVARYNLLGVELLGTFMPQAPQPEHLRDFVETATAHGRVDVLKYLSKACAPEDIDQFWSDVTMRAIEHNRCSDVLVDDYITKQFSHTDKHTYTAQYDPARVCKIPASTDPPTTDTFTIEVKGKDAVFVALAGKGQETGLRAMSGDAYPFAVAMTEAAANGHLNVVKYLATRSDAERAGALVVAARHGRYEIVLSIICEVMEMGKFAPVTYGVDTSVLECALSWAAWNGYFNVTCVLLDAVKYAYNAEGKNWLQLFHHCAWVRLCAMNACDLMRFVHRDLSYATLQNMPADIRAKVIDGFRACLEYGSPSADALLMMMQDMRVTYEDVFADGWTVSYRGLMLWKTIMKTWAPGEFAPLRALLEKVLEERLNWTVDTGLRFKRVREVPDEYWCPEGKSAYKSLIQALDRQVDDYSWREPAEEPGAAQ